MKIDKFKIKIFLWYLVTEPYRQTVDLLKNLFVKPVINIHQWFKKQNNNLIWALVFAVGFSASMSFKKKWIAFISLIIIILIMLFIEYQRGYYMHLWRKKEIKRVKKKFDGGKLK